VHKIDDFVNIVILSLLGETPVGWRLSVIEKGRKKPYRKWINIPIIVVVL
jgi:hypothetical protein